MSILNAMTVDVEDYFHVAAFDKDIRPDDWGQYESRVERNTHKLLDLFGKRNINATFFVLGWTAERCPQLIRTIAQQGHEIACHGYSHQLVYNQTPELFLQETKRAKGILEDISSKSIKGYRAASYSITNNSRWALDILVELGFQYDSSIFPVKHDRYGIPDSPKLPYRLKTEQGNNLVEFPLSTLKVFNYSLPVAGGGYFRLYPYHFTRYALGRINKNGNPFVFYLHPWEIDPGQPRIKTRLLSRFRHYNNLNKCEDRLERLTFDFSFTTAWEVLQNYGLVDQQR